MQNLSCVQLREPTGPQAAQRNIRFFFLKAEYRSEEIDKETVAKRQFPDEEVEEAFYKDLASLRIGLHISHTTQPDFPTAFIGCEDLISFPTCQEECGRFQACMQCLYWQDKTVLAERFKDNLQMCAIASIFA